MYTQIMYKDAKILELTKIIDEKDKQIMDCQEAVRERDEVNKAKAKAIQVCMFEIILQLCLLLSRVLYFFCKRHRFIFLPDTARSTWPFYQ